MTPEAKAYVERMTRRIAELEAYNTTRTDELAAAARRIAELEQQRDELLAALELIAEFKLLSFTGPCHMALRCVLEAEAAIAKVKQP